VTRPYQAALPCSAQHFTRGPVIALYVPVGINSSGEDELHTACTSPYWLAPHCTALYCTALPMCCAVSLHPQALHCTAPHALHCTVLHRALHLLLPCTPAKHCPPLHRTTRLFPYTAPPGCTVRVLCSVALHCTALFCTACLGTRLGLPGLHCTRRTALHYTRSLEIIAPPSNSSPFALDHTVSALFCSAQHST
jgi:hypothetical protein